LLPLVNKNANGQCSTWAGVQILPAVILYYADAIHYKMSLPTDLLSKRAQLNHVIKEKVAERTGTESINEMPHYSQICHQNIATYEIVTTRNFTYFVVTVFDEPHKTLADLDT
jgi:hypothetical protein